MSAALRFLGIVATLVSFAGSAWGQTLACNPQAPRSDSGIGFTPFGAAEQLLARGGQSGPAWEWALGPDTEGSQSAKGSLDWVSGKLYQWTLAYTGAGAASLEVRDGAALVLSLAYPSGMDAGNSLQLQVATNPSVGAGTTISAAAATINGQAVSGSISQTGNNAEAQQNLYFYYPPMSQGFSAVGTVSFTYASLPAGARVQFSVRAGTIACQGGTNTPPTVSITAPTANAVFNVPASIAVSANAADTDGTVTQVQFFANGNPIGTATTSPYTIQWANVAAGAYSLTAVATDNSTASTTSAAVPIVVNALPTVSLTSPAAGASFNAPAMVTVTANAADSDGLVTKVDFYDGATLVGTAAAAPFSVTLSNVAAGSHSYTAVATDNRNATATSAAVAISVNAPPAVSITTPAANASFNAPAIITVTATAVDTDGTITKVDFYQGATLIGTATASPFTIQWSSVAAGSYTLTAIATDNANATTTSAAVPVTVNALPTVSITAPAANAIFSAPASITVTATAADTDGTIQNVDFYQGTTLIGTVTASPYTIQWTNVAAGSYTLTAVATDNANATTTSAAVAITVNALPTVSITAPAANAIFSAPASITVTATAADADGTIQKVDFYQGATLIGTATASPYTIQWTNVAAGAYSLTAVAIDERNAATTSAAVAITVNALPTVAITAPTTGATFGAPATITVTATANDTDGTIIKVDFYQGTTLIGTATANPYTIQWTNVAAGSYSLTAIATDNLGGTATSAAVPITVNVARANYYIHPDHLNTPRLVADATGMTVWRNDNTEPFGNNPPDENPSGLGTFEFPLRFPGQYADKETGLAYNMARDYDPATGRFDQFDPIGLRGGINGYAYVRGNPLALIDSIGYADVGMHAAGIGPITQEDYLRIAREATKLRAYKKCIDSYLIDQYGDFFGYWLVDELVPQFSVYSYLDPDTVATAIATSVGAITLKGMLVTGAKAAGATNLARGGAYAMIGSGTLLAAFATTAHRVAQLACACKQ